MKPLSVLSKVCLAALIGVCGSAAAWDSGEHREKMLVLGDSVAFGYINSAGYAYVNPDKAGLLNVSNPITTVLPYTCDIHPSQSGHRVIAKAIAHALSAVR